MHFNSLSPGDARSSEKRPFAATDAYFGGDELAAKINQANLWLRPTATVVDRECSRREPAPGEGFPALERPLPRPAAGRGDLSSLLRGLRAERERKRLKQRALAVALGAAVSGLLTWSVYQTAAQESAPAGGQEDIGLAPAEDGS